MLLTAQLKINYYICYNKKIYFFFRKYITKYNSRCKFRVLNYILGECYIFQTTFTLKAWPRNISVNKTYNKYFINIF